MCVFMRSSSLPRFHSRSNPCLASTTGLKLPWLSSTIFHRRAVHPHHFALGGAGLLKADIGMGDIGTRKSGISVWPGAASQEYFSTTPKSSALPRQALTQAGLKPTSRRSTHILADLALNRVELRGVIRTYQVQ